MAGIVDKSLHFGGQNFFFIKDDASDPTYEYVGYMTVAGVILMARFTQTGTVGLYWAGTGDFDTIWTNRASVAYGYPNLMKDPTIA